MGSFYTYKINYLHTKIYETIKFCISQGIGKNTKCQNSSLHPSRRPQKDGFRDKENVVQNFKSS